jgi:hypothetical protein
MIYHRNYDTDAYFLLLLHSPFAHPIPSIRTLGLLLLFLHDS